MANYLLIESRDPYDSNDTQFCCDLAKQLAQQGEAVTVFLVQNGVFGSPADVMVFDPDAPSFPCGSAAFPQIVLRLE